MEENICAIKWMTETENSFSWGLSNDPVYASNNASFYDMGLAGLIHTIAIYLFFNN